MSLKRLKERFAKQTKQPKLSVMTPKDIAVKSNLIELVFANTPTLLSKQKILLEEIGSEPNSFFTFSRGIYDTALIISSNLDSSAKKIFQEEKLIFQLKNLSAITITFHQDTVKTPGVYYLILKSLAWEGINIIEVISSFTELTIIFEDPQINQAFAVLKNLTQVVPLL